MSEIEEALFPLNKIDILILIGLKRMQFDSQVRTRIIKIYKHIKLMRKREIQSFLFKNPTRPQRIPFAFENDNLVELVRKIGIEEYTKKYIDYFISLDVNFKQSFKEKEKYNNLGLYNCMYNEYFKKDTIGSNIVNVENKLYLSKEKNTSKDILYLYIPKLEDIITNIDIIDIPDPDSIIESVTLEQHDNNICYFNKYENLFNLNITIPIFILWDVRIKIILKRIGKLKEINILYHSLRKEHRKKFINNMIDNTIDNMFIMDIPPTRVVKDNSILYYKRLKFCNSDINNEMYDIYTTIKYPLIGKAVIDLDN